MNYSVDDLSTVSDEILKHRLSELNDQLAPLNYEYIRIQSELTNRKWQHYVGKYYFCRDSYGDFYYKVTEVAAETGIMWAERIVFSSSGDVTQGKTFFLNSFTDDMEEIQSNVYLAALRRAKDIFQEEMDKLGEKS